MRDKSLQIIRAAISGADEWRGCYDGGWQGLIVPEAFAHPAKFSRGLIRRIYLHAFVEGWLVPGNTIVDPFGGVALGALDAMWNGLTWVGCELEPRFVSLATQNMQLWKRKYGDKPGFGNAMIIEGDSRKLASVIATTDLICSSPPYLDAANLKSIGIDWDKAGRPDSTRPGDKRISPGVDPGTYGRSPGQLGAMKEGEAPRVDCVVSSPPFSHPNEQPVASQSRLMKEGYDTFKSPAKMSRGSTHGNLESMPEGNVTAVISSPPYVSGGHHPDQTGAWGGKAQSNTREQAGYGRTQGQMGRMKEGDVAAVISSPPYDSQMNSGGVGTSGLVRKWCEQHGRNPDAAAAGVLGQNKQWPETEGQMGNQSGETFWQAASEIVAQCYAILRPGGHAIWVCKDFVRKGQRVPFSDQWQALCESQGFRLVCHHRAMLVTQHGFQADAFGDEKELKTERKSFFRRLHEKRPGAKKIDWEDVLCLVKP